MKKQHLFFTAFLGSLLLVSPIFYGCTSPTKTEKTATAIPQS